MNTTLRQRRALQRITQDVIVAFVCYIVGLTIVLHGTNALDCVAGALLLVCTLVFARDARRAWVITKATR